MLCISLWLKIICLFCQEYNMNTVSKEVELPGAFVLGAAGAPSRVVGMNAEVNCLLANNLCFTQQIT